MVLMSEAPSTVLTLKSFIIIMHELCVDRMFRPFLVFKFLNLVMHEHVTMEISFLCKALAALFTSIPLFITMNIFMTPEMAFLGEALPTLIANIFFLLSVHKSVAVKMHFLSEPLTANLTFKPALSMHHHMTCQVTFHVISFST